MPERSVAVGIVGAGSRAMISFKSSAVYCLNLQTNEAFATNNKQVKPTETTHIQLLQVKPHFLRDATTFVSAIYIMYTLYILHIVHTYIQIYISLRRSSQALCILLLCIDCTNAKQCKSKLLFSCNSELQDETHVFKVGSVGIPNASVSLNPKP